jgi:NADPH-dependent curcumin reductase CurA
VSSANSKIHVFAPLFFSLGATAFEGLIKTLRPKRGETLFVSAASGAVGSLVGQVAAKTLGLTVVGSAGGARKKQRLLDLGFHSAIDYKTLNSTADLIAALKLTAPEGIDMYFENVGGMHFEAAFRSLRFRGRIAVCGAISSYNEESNVEFGLGSQSKLNIGAMIYSRQRIEGFLATDSIVTKLWLPYFAPLVRNKQIVIDETFYSGLEQWPKAFMETMNGNHMGKTVVRI